FRDAGKHRSLNGGWTAAAMAGGLDLALGGPVEEGGTPRRYPWIGDGRARAGVRDIRLALFVFA
ncbi:MAG: cobalamin biosynthesis protein, partial [Gemmatimonadetes bacterium]|nr:cobalamin biosynthesis protein [Gemmatimonadota bacterium]